MKQLLVFFRLLLYSIILILALDSILYPILLILFIYIELKNKVNVSVFHGIIDEVRKEIITKD